MGKGTRAIAALAGTAAVIGLAWHFGALKRLTDLLTGGQPQDSENPPQVTLNNPGNMETIDNKIVVFGGTLGRNSVTNAAVTLVRIEVFKDLNKNRQVETNDPRVFEHDIQIQDDTQGFLWTAPALANDQYVVRVRAQDAAGNSKGLVRGFIVNAAAPAPGPAPGPAPAPNPSPGPAPAPGPAPSPTRLTESQIQNLVNANPRLGDLLVSISNMQDRCILGFFVVQYANEIASSGFTAIEHKAIAQKAGDRFALLFPGQTPRWPCP